MIFEISNSSPKNVLVQGIVQREILRSAKNHLRGRLVDIGCGNKPYQQLIRPYVTEHIGIDHKMFSRMILGEDMLGSAYKIPAPPNSFDSAICTAVLEHLEEPECALRECYRILKADGVAIYTIPFIWHLHEEPRDFYRFSKYGLEYLFKKSGFDIVEIKALSGFWVTFGQLFVYNLYRLNRGPLRWFRVIDALGLLLQGVAYCLDHIDRTEQWTWMYMVIARKGRPPDSTTQSE